MEMEEVELDKDERRSFIETCAAIWHLHVRYDAKEVPEYIENYINFSFKFPDDTKYNLSFEKGSKMIVQNDKIRIEFIFKGGYNDNRSVRLFKSESSSII